MATETVEFHKLKLAELKQECLACGLETKGIKQDLIHRLQVAPLHSSLGNRTRLHLKKKKKKKKERKKMLGTVAHACNPSTLGG
uniref:SAP domain-containing ribonucleoprotein n=1 Tax=Theropithecus gelada TaxID=9565 RepID=A0A8D2E6X9_THEGE